MTTEELRDYVEEQRSLNNIPYHVYSALIDGIDTLEQEPKSEWEHDHEILKAYVDGASDVLDKIRAEIIQMPTISFNANDIYKADVLEIIDKYKAESEEKI